MQIKVCGDAGPMLLKKASISNAVRDKIAQLVKNRRNHSNAGGKCPTRVMVHDGRSRRKEFICCDEGMIVVDVYLPEDGQYSQREYKAQNPSFVCAKCFAYKGPSDYTDLGPA